LMPRLGFPRASSGDACAEAACVSPSALLYRINVKLEIFRDG